MQTRVPRELETRLKQEASRRRVTLSYLIRSLLEDTVSLGDGVLDSVDGIVAHSVELAENVGRDALRIARTAAGEGRLLGEDRRERRDRNTGSDARDDARGQPDPVPAHLAHVDAWNPVIVNRPASCAVCEWEMVRGDRGYLGLGEGPMVWLCDRCIREL